MTKKLIILFALIVTLLLLGCTKEEASLVGTKWVRGQHDTKEVIEFTSVTDVRMYEADGNLNYSTSLREGKYSYHGSGKVIFEDESIFMADIQGVTIRYLYYFKTATVNGDILHVNVKTVCESENDTWADFVDENGFEFMKVK